MNNHSNLENGKRWNGKEIETEENQKSKALKEIKLINQLDSIKLNPQKVLKSSTTAIPSQDNRGKFIVRNSTTGLLEVEGTGEIVRFASLCAPDLFDNDGFEKEDTLRTISGFGKIPVTRTYTLKITSKNVTRGHINGWDPIKADFLYDDEMFKSIDQTIALASRNNVRLIIPIINQDFGSEETNWVGNFTDLIRLRRSLKTWQEAKMIDWWSDPESIDSTRDPHCFLVSIDRKRVNTYTGIRIGDDPTILAFETGNEMNSGGYKPAPAAWTLEIAAHIKRLAPKTLIMDGSFARCDSVEASHEREVLQSNLVDIISWHYYGYGETDRLQYDVEIARKNGKVFMCGEYGFFANASEVEKFLNKCATYGVSGTLIWSLRAHSSKGGFKTHGEGKGIWSYHAPGWLPYIDEFGSEPEWDYREKDVISVIRKAAFDLTSDMIITPNLSAPYLFFVDGGKRFTWRGSAWADTYEIWGRCRRAGLVLLSDWINRVEYFYLGVNNMKEGRLKYSCQSIYDQVGGYGELVYIKMRAVSTDDDRGPFSNLLGLKF
ncbi:family 5 glycoside hydrolase [Melampsora larici-populina 98AG31]|uniref:mannan endo-1,4-beta-mannosidase n=1 Tax=Melampsora larici-populina (strain 98AG31 / pathotype 3-4-7) TaxID=747676 RepID=F4S545_MELLP|nr:family 5 glycoside hydrolase [Melampsora larici-populina 98AG31]EGG00256.1 family 5 glycoside hydrolase [Melampsora larici-populina 98AG31]